MRVRTHRRTVALVASLTLALSLGRVAPAAAVASAATGGIRITNPGGGPVAGATVKITFNGATSTATTDDDGLVAVVLATGTGAARDDRPGAVILVGDGTGTIVYEGGPEGGETFTVRGGTLAVGPAAAASQAAQGGKRLGTKTLAIAGGAAGAVLLGAVALGGGDSSTGARPPVAAPPVNVTRFYGNFTATLIIGNSSVNQCGQPETAQIPVTLTGNADGTGFTLSKGGLPFTGTMRADGSFTAEYAGGINGFPGLANGTGVRWPIQGTSDGTRMTASGEVTVTTGNCNGARIASSLSGTRN